MRPKRRSVSIALAPAAALALIALAPANGDALPIVGPDGGANAVSPLVSVPAHPAAIGPAIPGQRPPGLHNPANKTSSNWGGYIATKGHYQSVSASWTEPAVQDCGGGGQAVFWVGLDGYGSQTVEQLGSGADCGSGSPNYYAWWETYPNNSIQQYGDTVQPGDKITATVTDQGSNNYSLTMSDSSQGWSESTPVQGPSGASDASAEIVAEAPTAGSQVNLPNFGSITFTGNTIDGKPLSASGAEPYDMAPNGQTVATTSQADSNGDFTVTWQ